MPLNPGVYAYIINMSFRQGIEIHSDLIYGDVTLIRYSLTLN